MFSKIVVIHPICNNMGFDMILWKICLVSNILFYYICLYVLCCDVRYDFYIKAVFGSSLSPVVCRSVDVLFVIFVCVYIVVSTRIDYMSNMKGIRDRNYLHFTNTWVHPGYG